MERSKTNLERDALRLCPQSLQRLLRKLLLELELGIANDLDDLSRDATEVTGEEDLGTRLGELFEEFCAVSEEDEGIVGREGNGSGTVVGVVLSAGDGDCGRGGRVRTKKGEE